MRYKAIFFILPVLAALLGAVLPHTQRASAQVDCNATPDDPACQSSSAPNDNSNPPPAADCNANPNDPSCQSSSSNNNQPTVSCDPNDPNPPSECNQASQPNSDGSCPAGTGLTSYGSCCPHGTMNVHAYCETKAQNDKNIEQSHQNVCNIIGAVGALTGHWFQTATGWVCK